MDTIISWKIWFIIIPILAMFHYLLSFNPHSCWSSSQFWTRVELWNWATSASMTWTARISSRAAAAPPSDTASAPPTLSSWIPSAVCHVSRQSQSLANPKVGVQNVCRANNGRRCVFVHRRTVRCTHCDFLYTEKTILTISWVKLVIQSGRVIWNVKLR